MGNTPFKDQWFKTNNAKALEKWLRRNEVDWRNEYGNTVAHWACWRKQLTLLKLAQKYGANLDIQNNGLNTPLILAAYRNSFDCTEYLLTCGADTTLKNVDGDTALEVAERHKHTNIVELIKMHELQRSGKLKYDDADEEEDDAPQLHDPDQVDEKDDMPEPSVLDASRLKEQEQLKEPDAKESQASVKLVHDADAGAD